MKLKSIIYALGKGKSRKQLVRSEGARRVKQAEKMLEARRLYKKYAFWSNYGMSRSEFEKEMVYLHTPKSRNESDSGYYSDGWKEDLLNVLSS